jgi:hypothetical protein
MSVTGKGIEFYERRCDIPPMHIGDNIGAIFQASVQGTQIQAVASAINASIQQVGHGAQASEIRGDLVRAVEDMVRAVRRELTVEQLAAYEQVVREFQQEVVKATPDKARLRRVLSVLSFLGDAEGTMQLTERAFTLGSHVAPYIPLLITLLNRLFAEGSSK